MKIARDILYGVNIIEVYGSTQIEVEALAINSRQIEYGWAFFALKGTSVDGHQYIHSAIQQGAVLIVCEQLPIEKNSNVTYIVVQDSHKALGIVAANFYDHPSEKLKLVGITGTNGKTTVSTLCYQLFKGLGYKVGLLSTVQNIINDEVYPSTHTTSDAIHINSLLHKMVEQGCEYAFMEVSSHAIHQDRIFGLLFTGGVFTNITHDHLDYHKTFMEYIYAKKKFFDNLPKTAFALVNKDDARWEIMLQNCKAKQLTFAIKTIADYQTRILEDSFNGLVLSIDKTELHTQLMGRFNAYNLLTVIAIADQLKMDSIQTLTQLSMLKGAIGRFEWIKSAQESIIGIVDYAHTPDALKNVLDTIREVRTGNEQLITIIGCGGDRDKGKRPKMALIASELSDKVIITTDNPRSEDPMDIIQQMQEGVPREYYKKIIIQADRKEAIRTATIMANKGDIILIAGKGHETYQEIKGVKYPFNDKAILQETFIEMNK
ncbi:MAG: UDP-N-acetylmuramoyl-L-alanyl-D-glutamate--2,6-diaminopimelate ligase [Chitinophagales bacterium]|nr:UDP-N-acetylmuramoyl-L-alanyl-D-glutamate--2,6-diaminopimelate ligase [Chitinophagales bacterium]MCZ2394534.1 UDP-N-acetylmuramoyl-L-alanyl-D-glutamate--2,6-diaminopimelate ligase [Chitinophagales bacterium]